MFDIKLPTKYLGILTILIAVLVLFGITVFPRTISKNPKLLNTVPPKISWSEPNVAITLSPGQNLTKDIFFTSTEQLTNISVEAVPEIARFLNIQPLSYGSVIPNQTQPVRLFFFVPEQTATGVYQGTIHIRNENKTIPQALKIVINVGLQTYLNNSLAFKINFPIGWTVSSTLQQVDSPVLSFVSPLKTRPEYGGDITVVFWSNSNHQSLANYFDGDPGPNLFADTSGGIENTIVNGKPGLWLRNVTGITTMDILIIDTGSRFLEFQVSGDPALFEIMLNTLEVQ